MHPAGPFSQRQGAQGAREDGVVVQVSDKHIPGLGADDLWAREEVTSRFTHCPQRR